MTKQLHAGTVAKGHNRVTNKIWHSNEDGTYFCGNWYRRTPEQLYRECQTTMRDLLINHPELADV